MIVRGEGRLYRAGFGKHCGSGGAGVLIRRPNCLMTEIMLQDFSEFPILIAADRVPCRDLSRL